MVEDKIVDVLKNIDLGKLERKTIRVVVGFIGGYLLVHLAYKFIDDNFDFRVKRLSNRPDEGAGQNNNV